MHMVMDRALDAVQEDVLTASFPCVCAQARHSSSAHQCPHLHKARMTVPTNLLKSVGRIGQVEALYKLECITTMKGDYYLNGIFW